MIRFLAGESINHHIVAACLRREPARGFLSVAKLPLWVAVILGSCYQPPTWGRRQWSASGSLPPFRPTDIADSLCQLVHSAGLMSPGRGRNAPCLRGRRALGCYPAGSLPPQFPHQPRLSEIPVTPHRSRGDLQSHCNFLFTQPTEITQFDNLSLAGSQLCECFQRLIQSHKR